MFKNHIKSIMKSKRTDRKIMIKSIISFFISLTLCELIVVAVIVNRHYMEHLKMERLIMEKSMKLNDVISKSLYKTQAISALVIKSNGKIEDFERAAALFLDDPAILNVLIAPNGIVSAVYPYQGNESVIGWDFFKEGAGNKEAVMAKETGKLVFGGPFDLAQGGQALVGRLPVFMESAYGQKKFWGIVSVALKYPDALNAVGLTTIESSGLSYVIWRINPDNNEKQIIAQGNNYNPEYTNYVEKHIEIFNANWFFRVTPILNWYQNSETWILSFIGLCVSFLIAYIVKSNMELKTAKSQLESKVIETSVLSEKLEKAKDHAEQANKAKNIFLENINHEIRTPMSGIIGFAELATYDNIDSSIIKDYLDKIRKSADGLMGIIDEMLDISKIESKEIALEQIPFNINEVLTVCVAITNLKAMEKGLKLSANLEPHVTKRVLGDPAKLRQVLLSLLSNAMKFMSEGSISLTVTAENKNENEIIFKFEIKESGIRIPPKQIKRIPKDTFNGNNIRHFGAFGIRFNVAEKLLKLMGSNLEIESIPDEGSVFRFEITLKTIDDEVTENNITISGQKTPIFKGNILVCEDNEINQIVTKGHLKRMGLNVTIAEDGKMGVELAQAQMINGQPFDLIFMDIHMPVMDGLQATKKLIEMGNKTPIVALTANILLSDIENYQKNGINDYLGKPFNTKKLRECLLRYLKPAGYIKEQSYETIEENASQKQISTKYSAIDKKTGLEQYDGDIKAYENVLHIFAENNKNTLTKIKDALKSNNLKTAHLMAHSLKGASNAVGATKLAVAAFNVEKKMSPKDNDLSCFNNTKDMSIEMALLEKEYNAVYDELNTMKKENTPHQSDNISREKALELINRITPFLETGDSKILEYQDEIKGVFLPLLEKYNLFITQMEQYDFELANETIKSIQKFMKE